jgi:hypothetical protein
VGRRFDPDRAHYGHEKSQLEYEVKKKPSKPQLLANDIHLKIFITHFVPPKVTAWNLLRDFMRPRLSKQYLRSWARLLKHGSRGDMPWKKDIMTKVRRDANKNRLFHLHNSILFLSKIPAASLEIHIHTNSQVNAEILRNNWQSLKIFVVVHEEFNNMNVLNNSPWIVDSPSNPWLLTWQHKVSLLNAIKKGQKNSIYICMEDDALFAEDNLNYFLKYKEKLKNKGLLPSFLRIEWSYKHNEFVPIDHFQKAELSAREIPNVEIDNRLFVELPNSYSGIIVLDQELAEEYSASPASKEFESRMLSWWDIGARAAMGLQFVNVPKGFNSRNVVMADKGRTGIDMAAWVAHQPNIYAQKIGFLKGVTPNTILSKKGFGE